MGRKADFLGAMRHEDNMERVPLWELHFHIWNKYSKQNFVSGKDFLNLSSSEKITAIKQNAQIIAEVGESLGFGGVTIPDSPWDCIYTLPNEYRNILIMEIKKLNPDFAIVAGSGGIISMPDSSENYMNFCYRLFDEVEEIDCECKNSFEKWSKNVALLADASVDAVYVAADVADNRAPFFNREQLERWYFPYLEKCIERLKALGVFAILHTDGNINMILDDIKKSGLDALQAIDPIAGMDIVNVKQIFDNKVTVCGNLDCGLMLAGKPEEIYEDAKTLIENCKHGGGFILGNSNAVVLETPRENYDAFLKAWKDFGSY